MTSPHTEKLGGVYSALINDETMEPRISCGEIAYFDASRNDYGRGFVVVTVKDAFGRVYEFIKQFKSFDENELVLCQLNPPLDLHFKRENVVSIHPITHVASCVKH